MSNKPLVSIITPCYNGETFVHRYFESILSQTYDNIELIFVNDGSTDNTESIALSYKEKLEGRGISVTYIYQENAGQADAINKALKLFKGEYLTWPDSDDWMPFDMIERQVEYLELNRDKGFVLNKCQYISENDFTTILYTRERKDKSNGYLFEDFIRDKDVYWAAGAIMVRSELFLKCVPQRDIFVGTGGQNWQLILPISYGYECGFLDEPIYNILRRDNSHSRIAKDPERAYAYALKQENTVLETIMRINMDQEAQDKYIRIAKYEQSKKRFYLAVEFCDRKNVKKFYKEMKLNGKITPKMYIQYVIFKNSFLSKIYNTITQK